MKRFCIFLILVLFTGTGIFAQADLQPVAIVRLTKSEPITVKQLKSEIEKLIYTDLANRMGRAPTTQEVARGVDSLTTAQRKEALDAMINERLAIQAAERDRITVTDNELNQQINQLRTQMVEATGRQPTEDEFAQAIRAQFGQDMPTFREWVRRQMTVEKYLMSKKQNIITSITQPTEAEIVSFYNLAKAQFIRPDTIRFSMIQVPYGADTASKARAKETADRLTREIGSNPGRFDEAVVRGQAPNSGYMAGDGGYLPLNLEARQVAGGEFIDVAMRLKQGEVSRLIEGIRGYQIIKVTETLSQKNLELDDILQPGRAGTVRQYISSNLLQQKQEEVLAKATAELVSELRTGNPFQVMEANLNW